VTSAARRQSHPGWKDRGGQRGGPWDVVSVAPNGKLCFLECKRADEGGDRIRDNQRAFLEAALEVMDVAAFAVVSWRAARGLQSSPAPPAIRTTPVVMTTMPAARPSAPFEVTAHQGETPAPGKPWESNRHRKPPLRRVRQGLYETYDGRWVVEQVQTVAGVHWEATRRTPRLGLGRFPSRLAAFQALEAVDLRQEIRLEN
jgi:hypothetical protein